MALMFPTTVVARAVEVRVAGGGMAAVVIEDELDRLLEVKVTNTQLTTILRGMWDKVRRVYVRGPWLEWSLRADESLITLRLV